MKMEEVPQAVSAALVINSAPVSTSAASKAPELISHSNPNQTDIQIILKSEANHQNPVDRDPFEHLEETDLGREKCPYTMRNHHGGPTRTSNLIKFSGLASSSGSPSSR
jgi:hypothetical protein